MREWFGDIVISTDLESFQNVFFQIFAVRNMIGISPLAVTNVGGQCETVLFGHHHVEHTNIKLAFQKSFVTTSPSGNKARWSNSSPEDILSGASRGSHRPRRAKYAICRP
jgi:hypothetical protein